jgi:hypothetical protein
VALQHKSLKQTEVKWTRKTKAPQTHELFVGDGATVIIGAAVPQTFVLQTRPEKQNTQSFSNEQANR